MVLWLFAAAAFAAQRVWLLPILAVPLVFVGYALRAGVDADRRGLTVRALLGSRRVAWSQISGFRARRGVVSVVLAAGGTIRLPGVGADDLPVLAEAAGEQVRAAEPATPQSSQPAQPSAP